MDTVQTLNKAIKQGAVGTTRLLIKNNHFNKHEINMAFQYALYTNNIDIIKLIIVDKRVDLNIRNNWLTNLSKLHGYELK